MSIPRRSALKIGGLLGLSLGIGRLLHAATDDPPAKNETIEGLWTDLEKDEEVASRALLKLADLRKEAVAFFADKMKPLRVDPDWLQVRLERLGSKDEEVWKPAFEELEYSDPRLAKTLEELMKEVTTYPARSRMVEILSGRGPDQLKGKVIKLTQFGGQDGEPIMFNFVADNGSFWAEPKIEKLNGPNAAAGDSYKRKWTRAVRAIVLLEHVGSPEAIAILKTMATGDPGAQPTRSAKDALNRLKVS